MPEPIDIGKYEQWVLDRCFFPKEDARYYLPTALAGEVGEICNEVKKEIRDDKDIEAIVEDELGDVLFYLIAMAHEYNTNIGKIIHHNINKLEARHEADKRVQAERYSS